MICGCSTSGSCCRSRFISSRRKVLARQTSLVDQQVHGLPGCRDCQRIAHECNAGKGSGQLRQEGGEERVLLDNQGKAEDSGLSIAISSRVLCGWAQAGRPCASRPRCRREAPDKPGGCPAFGRATVSGSSPASRQQSEVPARGNRSAAQSATRGVSFEFFRHRAML